MLLDGLILRDQSADSKVAYLDASITVHQYVVQLDVTMQHTTTMTVRNTMDDLFENTLGSVFIKTLPFLDELQKVTTICILHHK